MGLFKGIKQIKEFGEFVDSVKALVKSSAQRVIKKILVGDYERPRDRRTNSENQESTQ